MKMFTYRVEWSKHFERRAGSGVEGAEPSPPGAVPAPAPWPPAFGCSVFAGEYRFRSPGVAASRVSLGGPGRSEERCLRGWGVRGGRGTLTCPPSGPQLARPAVCHPAGTSRPPGGLGPLRWVLPGRWSRPELPALGHSLGRALVVESRLRCRFFTLRESPPPPLSSLWPGASSSSPRASSPVKWV